VSEDLVFPASAAGAWLDRFKADEFALLNWSWLGEAPDRAEALRRFLAEGVERLAPIAFDAVFDPAYYRETHPEYAELSDEAAYRRWLFADIDKGWPGSAEEHLRRLGLALDRFPEGFAWRKYAAAENIVENRWFALQHLLDAGVPEVGFPPRARAPQPLRSRSAWPAAAGTTVRPRPRWSMRAGAGTAAIR
jgi:hypothetical protein